MGSEMCIRDRRSRRECRDSRGGLGRRCQVKKSPNASPSSSPSSATSSSGQEPAVMAGSGGNDSRSGRLRRACSARLHGLEIIGARVAPVDGPGPCSCGSSAVACSPLALTVRVTPGRQGTCNLVSVWPCTCPTGQGSGPRGRAQPAVVRVGRTGSARSVDPSSELLTSRGPVGAAAGTAEVTASIGKGAGVSPEGRTIRRRGREVSGTALQAQVAVALRPFTRRSAAVKWLHRREARRRAWSPTGARRCPRRRRDFAFQTRHPTVLLRHEYVVAASRRTCAANIGRRRGIQDRFHRK